jgi:hypothetical protein
MNGTEIVASAATVTLPIGVGFAGTMIVVVGMQTLGADRLSISAG